MKKVEKAKAWFQFLNSVLTDKEVRTRSRFLPEELREVALSDEQAVKLHLAGSKSAKCLKAAAILNANDIAMQIDAEGRQAIASIIDSNTRLSALQARAFGRPASGADAERIAENIRADVELCEKHWLDDLPDSVRRAARCEGPPTQDFYVLPAIRLAIEEQEIG